jgi:hypothetical protein
VTDTLPVIRTSTDIDSRTVSTSKKGMAMNTPRLSGYPVDREIARRAQLARQARRARHRAERSSRRRLRLLLG